MATPHNDRHQSHLNFKYFPIFNNRTSRHSEDPETADQRDYLEERYRLPRPIGLKLKEPWKVVELIERRLRQSKLKRISRNQALVDRAEKSKADHFPFSFLKIGSFEVTGTYAADLVAKCYYGKQKLVWEILHNGLKNKIEIPWPTILSMRTRVQENGTGILDLELNEPPSFFHEIDPRPRQHTLWRPSSDFTGGQASIYRRHYLEFPRGIVEKHLEKLLQLSRKRFPSLTSPCFSQNIPYGNNEHQLCSSQHIPPSQQFPVIPYGNVLPSLAFNQSPSPNSVMEERFPDETQLCSQPTPQSPQLPMFPYSNIPSSIALNQSPSLIPAEDCFQDPTLALLCDQELGGFANSSESHLVLDDPYGAGLHNTSSNYNNFNDSNQMLFSNWSSDIACENRHMENLWKPRTNSTSSGTQNDLYIPQSESELWALNAASNAHFYMPQSESELQTVNPANNANVNEEGSFLSSEQSGYFSGIQHETCDNLISITRTSDPSVNDESRRCNNNDNDHDRIDHHG